jgi:hypothetical protein
LETQANSYDIDNKYKIAKLTICKTKSKYKIECRATWTPEKYEGRIRCLGGVSILC